MPMADPWGANARRWQTDGFSNLNYTLVLKEKQPLYTRFLVELNEAELRERLKTEKYFQLFINFTKFFRLC